MKNIVLLIGVVLLLSACIPTDSTTSNENQENEVGKWDNSQTTWDNAVFGD